MSNVFTFVFCTVTVVLLAKLVHTWMKQKSKMPEPSADAEEMLEKIDRLEDRIRVLERIVTENQYDLKKEIESL